ncbi:helicase HerA domain-containing protein [Aeromonas caviae]|uniref:helicase HerA domain-containing protein n=1 Tax=Aeromonas caviae TaxID=648 RepID=UPI003015327D
MIDNQDPFEIIQRRGEQEKLTVEKMQEQVEQNEANRILGLLVQQDQYVGETLRMDFRNITVQVHDHHRKIAGGIPHLSYLVASRIQHWKNPINWAEEDASVLLLRVIGAAPTPSDMMDTIVRAEAARRATGKDSEHWEAIEHMDSYTRYQLSFAGLKCEVVGTFYLGKNDSGNFELKFGTDINNFYPNSGLKVYKPIEEALKTIVNFRDPTFTPEHPLKEFTVQIGHVRYASTNRPMQGVDEVPVSISPVDLLAQRTALFGMSRTGKSNTTKIIARSIYHLRSSPDSPVSVGQLIFDYNGEYANENTQGGSDVEANALKNVWRERYDGVNEVVTYGLSRPKNDPDRRLLQINAFGNKVRDWNNHEQTIEDLDMLCVGKNILGDLLADDSAKYVKNFCEVDLSVPDNITDGSKQTRYRRAVLIYRALLKKAGLDVPGEMQRPDILGLRGNGLFGKELLDSMRSSPDKTQQASYTIAANILDPSNSNKLTWDKLGNALEILATFISSKDSGYSDFNTTYIQGSSTGEPWADQNVSRILEMFRYANGAKSVARLAQYHDFNNSRDFAQQIYEDLLKGNLVIIDQAGGEPSLNEAAARRIMWQVFKGNQRAFISGETPKDILIYVEEAHNLLPPSKEDDLKDVWVRTAKEGSKYRIGLVYATQEVSSIQKNILKNTANWFISHLNNTDETRELKKFYDFSNFEDSILRAQNRGFLRAKMLSNPYVNPVQIERFVLNVVKPVIDIK